MRISLVFAEKRARRLWKMRKMGVEQGSLELYFFFAAFFFFPLAALATILTSQLILRPICI
jgi:hypothetical protein